MEKFTAWRDKGTGISPFIPTSYPKRGISILADAILFILKFPFFLLTLPFALLGISAVKRFHLTFLFNFKYTIPQAKKNDFVVINYSSPLLVYLLGGVILIPDASGILYQYSNLQLLKHAFGGNVQGQRVEELSKYKGKTIYCLIEGTPTNNKAILKFTQLPKYTFDGFNLKSLIVKITPNHFNLPLPSSKFMFLFYLLSKQPSSIALRLVPHGKFDFELSKVAFRNANLHTVNFTIEDKLEFYKYYQKSI